MATAFTGEVRKWFAQHTLPTAFLQADAIKAARASYKLHRKELRAKKDRGPECSVKLPVCESIRMSLKKRLWTGLSWSDPRGWPTRGAWLVSSSRLKYQNTPSPTTGKATTALSPCPWSEEPRTYPAAPSGTYLQCRNLTGGIYHLQQH